MNDFLNALRDDHRDFDEGKLEDHHGKTPFDLFSVWYKEAFEKEIEPNAMSIATAGQNGQPSNRIVYLKECLDEQFIFYSNYLSDKGREIADNPKVNLLFFWPQLQRQLRIDGVAKKVSEVISDEYFNSRPRGSQLGAWASMQSQKLESRNMLEEKLMELDKKYPNYVPRPPHWGGYVIEPNRIEFWQGRPSRLHDRIVYEKSGLDWKIYRLNP
ncbi:pyridoxamine 5'-phosphate oxidase [Crocinitomicaceae bacterium]|jgi:pyridoxamine 5'-phosphate oxidase|nr:pyridoxamine 5'-phosphate oxidase [Crocinitomicaceae bacterium]MDG1346792.1 pyridoxamine 5'-phosphate oxidase [Crocinitomicaceae bacterium]MDG2463780.1 pyridoxamine 5'-phosphate oxidase [Crocinitomicaceae bacterium]